MRFNGFDMEEGGETEKGQNLQMNPSIYLYLYLDKTMQMLN